MATRMESGENEEVCIVVCPFESYYEYYIYIVNLSKVGDVKEVGILAPRIPDVVVPRKRVNGSMAFAVRDSVLYMLGGLRYRWGTKSYAYTLPSTGNGNGKRTTLINSTRDKTIKALPSMASPKYLPRAVMIGRRICVFSASLKPYTANFELYDPDSSEWSPVPNLPLQFSRYRETIELEFYYVEGHRLFVKTYLGSFVIDFDSTELEWAECVLPAMRNSRFPFGCVKEGALLFTPLLEVFDTDEREPKEERYIPGLIPRRPPKYRQLKSCNRAVTALRKKDNERLRACVVQIGRSAIHLDDDKTALAIHLMNFDAQANPTVLKSHMFHMDPSILDDDNILFVFPL